MWEVRETLEYHQQMLTDEPRTAAFARAIAATVRPGDVVLDLGTGTGILAMLAARAGARAVYAIESNPVAELARRVVAANGLQDTITVVEASSFEVTLPEPADVLVSEILWNAGLGEGVVASFSDARARLLKPDARIIPARVEMWIAPVESAAAFAAVDTWSADLLGFDYSPVRDVAADSIFTLWFGAGDALAEGVPIGAIDLAGPLAPGTFAGETEFRAQRDGVLHGLTGWFAAEIAAGVSLTNAPPVQGSWMHAYLPVKEAIPLQAGDRVRAQIEIRTRNELWEWSVEAGGSTQGGSTAAPHLRPLHL
jgi:SAM-dependent methyltransferase